MLIKKIPKDIILLLLNYVDDQTLKQVFLTNKYFKNIDTSDIFWYNRILFKFPYIGNYIAQNKINYNTAKEYYIDLIYKEWFTYDGITHKSYSDKTNTTYKHMFLYGAEHNRIDFVLIGLHNNIHIDTSSYEYNSSGLSLAAEHGNTEIVNLFVNNNASINVRDDGGVTPLMWAIWNGHEKIINLLLNRGADPSLADTEQGITTLMVAARESRMNIVKMLIDLGVDVQHRNYANENVLEYAIRMKEKYDYSSQEIINYLNGLFV